MNNTKIHSFTDLNAWKEGHKLVLAIYKASMNFPTEERFCLTDQMRRAAISVTSNIAEGFSRKSSKEKSQFLHIALGSLTEMQNQLLVSKDLKYIDVFTFKKLADQTIIVGKLVNGLIKSSKKFAT